MPSTSEIMNKLRASKKGKYFREGEESRAYQFLNKNEEIGNKQPKSPDLKSGSGTNPKLESFLKAVVDGKLSLREVKVYSCLILERQPEVKISGNELAKKTQISRGTITQIVKSLIQKGYLEKQPSQDSMNVYRLT